MPIVYFYIGFNSLVWFWDIDSRNMLLRALETMHQHAINFVGYISIYEN